MAVKKEKKGTKVLTKASTKTKQDAKAKDTQNKKVASKKTDTDETGTEKLPYWKRKKLGLTGKKEAIPNTNAGNDKLTEIVELLKAILDTLGAEKSVSATKSVEKTIKKTKKTIEDEFDDDDQVTPETNDEEDDEEDDDDDDWGDL